MKFLCTVSVAMILGLTGCSTMPWHREPPKPTPQIVANCPPLTPLADDSFGSTALKLIEVAGIYYRCREAALAAD